MKTAFEILEVEPDADNARIKSAYLSMVKRYPPERFPEEFQRVYRAYELIKTSEDRLKYRLFYCSLPEPSDIASLLLDGKKENEPPMPDNFQDGLHRNLQAFCKKFMLRHDSSSTGK